MKIKDFKVEFYIGDKPSTEEEVIKHLQERTKRQKEVNLKKSS